jgi:hypothetical protein
VARAADHADEAVSFFTVVGPRSRERLLGSGAPWPTDPLRSALGEGVYAVSTRGHAEAYRNFLLDVYEEPARSILEFRVRRSDLASFKSLDVDALGDAADAWVVRYSKLQGGVPDHGLEYITRGVGERFGREHFFDKSVFSKLHFLP